MRCCGGFASRLAFEGYGVSKQYDLIVIGGGSGGLAHAQRATEYGPEQTTNLEADPSVDVVATDFVDLADRML